MTMFLKYPFLAHHWWSALERLVTTLDAPGPVPAAALRFAYADLAGSLAAARQPDVAMKCWTIGGQIVPAR